MKYGKTMVIVVLAIFIFSASCAWAADADDCAQASEDDMEMKVLQNEETEIGELESENDGVLSEESPDTTQELAAPDTEYPQAKTINVTGNTFADIANAINNASDGDTVFIKAGRYLSNGSQSIDIDKSISIVGESGLTILDGEKTTSIFRTSPFISNITLTNITFINGYNYDTKDGGAIELSSSNSTISGCTFENNTVNRYGGAISIHNSNNCILNCTFKNNVQDGPTDSGAIYWKGDNGCVINCIFENNRASRDGGALYWEGDNGCVINCTFENNRAFEEGGAISWEGNNGIISNCIFNGNVADMGNDISAWNGISADSCIFKTPQSTNNVNIISPALIVDAFTIPSGEKLKFNLTTDRGMSINGNISISIYPMGSDVCISNYSCMSYDGWIVDLSVGDYRAVFNTEYEGFTPINRTITVTPPKHTFWALNNTINGNGNQVIGLSNDYYFDPVYDCAFVEGIVINRPVTIKGNGISIDAKGQARIFNVQSANTVIENITFKNACTNDKGGAIYISDGSIINCNFVNNTAEYGGAVYFSKNGNVTCCNFTDNKATGNDNYCNGGAVYMRSGSIESCNFDKNIASATNRASSSGGAVYFPINGNVTNCNFTNNKATGSDGWGGAIYISLGNIENCHFTDNYASADGGAIFFLNNGTLRNCNFTGNKASDNGGAIFFHIKTADSIMNCNFTNNKADNGGAIYFNFYIVASLENCNFTNNHAIYNGGAIYFDEDSNGSVMTCNFVGNHASYKGGAICLGNESNVTNCNFTSNYATSGSAIYFENTSATKTLSNSLFLNNRANVDKTPLNITLNGNDVEIVFMGRNNLLNAIYSDCNVNLVDVTYWGANGISNITDAAPIRSNREAGINITVIGVVNGNVVNTTILTDSDGKIVLNDVCDYWIIVSHEEDSYYTKAAETLFTNMNLNANLTSQTTTNKNLNITAKSNIYNEVMPGQLIFILPNGEEINATYGSNGIWWADYTFPDYGNYDVKAKYIGLDNVTVRNATITVNKIKTVITGNAVTATYNINKNLVITLKDSEGNILSGVNVIVDLKGAKTYTTDSNGQIRISTKGLAPKAYTAKVTFSGNDKYAPTSKDIKVTVKKAKPKIKAKKKTYKAKAKVKRFTITLKDNKGKPIKKAKVKLSLKKITKKAKKKTKTKKKKKKNIIKTNKKGKATFKIDRKTKGKYWATITYKGNKYFTKVTKKVKITLK